MPTEPDLNFELSVIELAVLAKAAATALTLLALKSVALNEAGRPFVPAKSVVQDHPVA